MLSALSIFRIAKPFLPYIAIALAVLGGILWINGMRADIARQRTQIAQLSTDLASEKQARARDVAGLTALSSGLVAASSAKQRDQEALSHAIDVQHPQPVSAGLSRLLVCLRAADQNRECSAAPGAGAGSATTAAGAH